VELVEDKETKTPASTEAQRIRTALRENGFLIGVGGVYGNVLRIQPPLNITEAELDQLVNMLKKLMA